MAYGKCENPNCPNIGTDKEYSNLRKDGYCYKCNPSKSAFQSKQEGVPGSDEVELQNSFNDLGLFSSLKTLQANGASTRDMILWLRNGDYSRKINHADIQRILARKFPRLPRKREAMRLRPYSLVDPCPECNQPHTHTHDEQVYSPAIQEVFPIGQAAIKRKRTPRKPRNYEGKVWLY